MILYHFTRPECLDAILRDGLKANKATEKNNMTGGRPAVWLTTRGTLVPSLKTRKIMLSRGVLFGPKSSNLPDATVCLSVTIGERDRKLHRFLPWLRKRHRGLSDPLLEENSADDWVYFGDIPPNRLAVLKHVPRLKPYWVLDFHKIWHETGAEAKFDPPQLEADLLAGIDGPPEYVEAMRQGASQ
jgi:hypothetical protein